LDHPGHGIERGTPDGPEGGNGPPPDGELEARPPAAPGPVGWVQVAIGALAAVLLILGGAGVEIVLDDDPAPAPIRITSAPRTTTLDRYMTRLGTEWAVFERLRGDAAGSKKPYQCFDERDRLTPLEGELEAIGASDRALRDATSAYVAGLDRVVTDCEDRRMTGQEFATGVFAAQTAWLAVRARALALGWSTPCALRNTADACFGA
jgi:hypothetical protein